MYNYRRPKPRRQTNFDPSSLIKQGHFTQKLEVYALKHQFADFPVLDTIKTNISRRGYVAPTPIQDQVIPLVLAGRDVVGVANTGTGKTAAFLVPLIDKLVKDRQEKVLVITPTRELAVQIREEFVAFAAQTGLQSVLCIGGVGMNGQILGLRKRPAMVIGTPGRLKDLVTRHRLNLAEFKTIVLDEVDRMLDMGFIYDVKELISRLPRQRQSLFFSATVEGKVNEVMRAFLHQPVLVKVQAQPITANVDQSVVRLNGRNKLDVLRDLLIQPGFDKVLVFGRTKWGMEKLLKALTDRGIRALTIHGNKSQGQRQRALTQFKRGDVKVLLATDVASRGLDIDQVTHVINFDLPQSREDYIHRIGRTGRADKKGVALTML
ncbi:MAG: DEAD/DEAH box helicase [Patescibacteria group bacterium]|nr:DEAD/DEAH box helicase [Candidatus Beckwithbacteria bacterium]MDZ4228957.1 DEAD/DEAH box helicase [Patescibacteria group bacterium]